MENNKKLTLNDDVFLKYAKWYYVLAYPFCKDFWFNGKIYNSYNAIWYLSVFVYLLCLVMSVISVLNFFKWLKSKYKKSNEIISSKRYFVFDVESTSLHGRGFAVGAIVFDVDGNIIDDFQLKSKEGEQLADTWVEENVIPHLDDMPWCSTNRELRDAFYDFYIKYKNSCEIWSDCNYPVETNFLNEVVKDNFESRQWTMPYPLRDISTYVDVEIDRAQGCGIENLQPHNPLHDSIASAVFLLKTINPNTKTIKTFQEFVNSFRK